MPVKIELHDGVAAPPERVFSALTDLDNGCAWMQGLVHIEKLTQGPFGIGTRWREVRRFTGSKASEEFDVVGFEPAKRLELFCDGKNGTSRRGHYRFVFQLESQEPGTWLTLSGEISNLCWFGELMGKLFSGAYKRMMARDLTAMKAYLEKSDTAAVASP